MEEMPELYQMVNNFLNDKIPELDIKSAYDGQRYVLVLKDLYKIRMKEFVKEL